MSVKAYVLVTTEAKHTTAVLKSLRSSKIVESADAIAGPYDIICTLDAETVDELGESITQALHRVEGVQRTTTCIVLKL